MFCFFFKQKTAYEMRISDWSSDVCSSDLVDRHRGLAGLAVADDQLALAAADRDHRVDGLVAGLHRLRHALACDHARGDGFHRRGLRGRDRALAVRSEEHTSELQSLIRISYAVCCLTQKN